MNDEIRIDADLMAQHARRIQQLTRDAAEATAAIKSINLGGGAFGALCAWMVPPVSMVSDAVSKHISGAEHVLERTGQEIQAVVRDFDSYEEEVLRAVRAIESDLR